MTSSSYESDDDCDVASNSTRVQRPARKTSSRIQMPSTFFFAQRGDGSGWHRVSVVVGLLRCAARLSCVCVCVCERPPFFVVKMPHIFTTLHDTKIDDVFSIDANRDRRDRRATASFRDSASAWNRRSGMFPRWKRWFCWTEHSNDSRGKDGEIHFER